MKKAIKGFALLAFVAAGTVLPFKKASATVEQPTYPSCGQVCTANFNYDCRINYTDGSSQYCSFYGPRGVYL
jgi:hypothetical protein